MEQSGCCPHRHTTLRELSSGPWPCHIYKRGRAPPCHHVATSLDTYKVDRGLHVPVQDATSSCTKNGRGHSSAPAMCTTRVPSNAKALPTHVQDHAPTHSRGVPLPCPKETRITTNPVCSGKVETSAAASECQSVPTGYQRKIMVLCLIQTHVSQVWVPPATKPFSHGLVHSRALAPTVCKTDTAVAEQHMRQCVCETRAQYHE